MASRIGSGVEFDGGMNRALRLDEGTYTTIAGGVLGVVFASALALLATISMLLHGERLTLFSELVKNWQFLHPDM